MVEYIFYKLLWRGYENFFLLIYSNPHAYHPPQIITKISSADTY